MQLPKLVQVGWDWSASVELAWNLSEWARIEQLAKWPGRESQPTHSRLPSPRIVAGVTSLPLYGGAVGEIMESHNKQ